MISPTRRKSSILSSRRNDKPVAYKYKRPLLYDKQREAIFGPSRYVWVEASTKSGKTHGCLVWLLEQALRGSAGKNYWWVAPSYGQAKIAFSRMQRGLKYIKHSVDEESGRHVAAQKGDGIYESHISERRITLANGAVIWFRSGENPDALYGEDVHAAVLDEASRLREEAFHAVRSTLTATEGPIRIIGNVKGRGNWFYKGCRNAKEGKRNHAYYIITAWDAIEAGVLKRSEIKDAQDALPPHVFAELYECKPSDNGWNPFGLEAIDRCIIDRMYSSIPVAAGWDLGRKLDWTVGVFLDINGRVCKFSRFQKPWKEAIEQIRNDTGHLPALVDATGIGDPVLDSLQRPYLKIQTNRSNTDKNIKRGSYKGNFEGFIFTGASKQELVEDLVLAVQSNMIAFPEGVIADEMREFEFQHTRTGVRYAAPEGCHDDAVMGLALAWRKFKFGQQLARIV